MKKNFFIPNLIALGLVFSTMVTSTCAYAADEFSIDPDHSKVTFRVRHLGISSVQGNFLKFSGSFSFDKNNINASKTEAKIEANSIDTRQAKRDEHLKSADFLTVDKFPTITFVSKKVEGTSPENFKVEGELSIRGVSKPVTLDVALGGTAKDPWGNERAAFTATTTINRKDYDLTWNKLLETGALVVGEEVKIELEVEGIKKKA